MTPYDTITPWNRRRRRHAMSEIVKADSVSLVSSYRSQSVIDAYIASLDLMPRSKGVYRKGIAYFFDWLDLRGVTEPRRQDVIEYKEYLKTEYAATTASSYLTAVRSFFAWLNAETGYPNIAANVKNPKVKDGHKKDSLSLEQSKALLSGMPRESLADKRDYALVSLLIHTGLRTIEAARADVGDIRGNLGSTVLYVWGKGRDSKDEFVKLTESVNAAIEDYIAARREAGERVKDSSPLFVSASNRDSGGRMCTRSISRICKTALRKAGLDSPRLTAHSFRHTAVSLPLQAGASIRDVQQMARHASPLTTERYAHDIRRLDGAAEDKLEALLTA